MNISASYSGWIDLFGWGTGNAPVKTGDNNRNYSVFTDWGGNPVINGGNMPDQWRTLKREEWMYLFHERKDYSSLFGMGTVNGIVGIIILPDDWLTPPGLFFTAGTMQGLSWQSYYYESDGNPYSDNSYSKNQWEKMEAAGAVFLPAAGYRLGTTVYDVGFFGGYCSSSQDNSGYAYCLLFSQDYLYPQNNHYLRYRGRSVRLVSDL